MLKLLLSGFIVFALVTRIHAAGFDCTKAETKVELAICNKDELSDLDSQMKQTYESTLANTKDTNSLKTEQKQWLKNIRNNCSNSDCLINVYRKRIAELDRINETADIKAYKIIYLSNGKVRLTHGSLSKIYNLADHIHGCLGNLYDCSTNKCIYYTSSPLIRIVSTLETPETTTLLLLVTASPNCNIQGECGSGVYNGFIALTITDKLSIVYLNSFTLDDCYSGRHYVDWEHVNEAGIDMLSLIKPINGQIKIEFVDSYNSSKDKLKRMLFDMKDPAKGFIVDPSVTSVFTQAEMMAMIEKLYGNWVITRYDGDSVMAADKYAKSQIGKKIQLLAHEYRFDKDFLWLSNSYCANASYKWQSNDDFIVNGWQALLPEENIEKRDGVLLFINLECKNKTQVGFEISKTGKLIIYYSGFWFFLDREVTEVGSH